MRTFSGADLRTLRSLAGKTTMQMAEAAGVKTRKTYENWEKNVGFPDVNQFFQMVSACNLDYDEFLQLLSIRDGKNKFQA